MHVQHSHENKYEDKPQRKPHVHRFFFFFWLLEQATHLQAQNQTPPKKTKEEIKEYNSELLQ